MGKQKNDMLHGSIWRGLPRFALPIAATAILGQLFNASDIAVVGNFAGAEPHGGGCRGRGKFSDCQFDCEPVHWHFARQQCRHRKAPSEEETKAPSEKTVHTSIVIAVLGGVLVALLGELCASWPLRSFHVPEDVFDPGASLSVGLSARHAW